MNQHPIKTPPPHAVLTLSVAFCLLLSGTGLHAAPPDLTAGGVPDNTRTTNLGPTGARGWVYHVNSGGRRADSSEARQIQVTAVAAGSPADGILAANDVILGANGTGAPATNFTDDAREALADAINDAEARNPATLSLLRWRAGTTTTVMITLRTMGAYSATAPYICPKSAKILAEGLARIMGTNALGQTVVPETAGRYSFGTLSLLAANDLSIPGNAARMARAETEVLALIPDAATRTQMMSDVRDTASGWQRGHTLIVLAEYFLVTGDTRVLPAIEAYAVNIAKNQSLFGTLGHIYAEKNLDGSNNGPMGGQYGPVNSAAMPCFLGVLLARQCALANPDTLALLDAAVERTSRFFGYYAGRGAIPYGEHTPGTSGHENNGKSGLAALCFGLQSNRVTEGKFFSQMATASTTERELGHTGAWFNYLWAPLGAAAGGDEAAVSHFRRARWYFDLARRWDGGFDYDCLNGEGPNSGSPYNDFRMSTAALLTYALPLRKLHLTGRGHDPLRHLSGTDVAEAEFSDGYAAATRSTNDLVTDLGNWSPTVQRLAGEQLATRSIDTTLLAQITNLATDRQSTSRIGACYTLGRINNSATANARAATLAGLLTDPENHVRYTAAEAMRYLPQTNKMTQLNAVLSAAASTASPLMPFDEEDPLHFAHGRLAILLFYSGNAYGPRGMIWGTGINGVNRNLLYPAIRAVAANPVGQARSTLDQTYQNLTAADVNALADTLVDSIHFRAPSDKMFSAGIRNGGLKALEKFDIADGVPLALTYMVEDGRTDAYTAGLSILQKYAGGCTTVNPDPDVTGFCNALLSGSQAAAAQTVLNAIAADPNPAPLTPFKSIQSVTVDAASLTLPVNQTTLRASASDLAEGNLVYTWRKVHGAGNVSFTPNGTAAAKDCAIVFDNIPGQYLFEVTVSDSRGFTEVYRTVPLTLYDVGGTLPPNSPPTADPQAVSTNPATVKTITLTATDPEAYLLIFSITSQPSHGMLSGTAPNLSYTSTAGYLGADSFTFQVMDTEGQTSSATVSINVSGAGIELYAYDGFDYAPGSNILTPLNGGKGFATAWARAQEGSNDSITVTTGAPGTGGTNTPVTSPGSLDGVFNNVAVTTNPAGSANRYIDGASGDDRLTALRKLSQSAGALAGADKVLWTSVVWTMDGSSYGRQVGFALGSDGLSNRSQSVSISTTWGGTGAGVAMGVGGAINSAAVTPTIWAGGNQVVRTTTNAKNVSTTQDNIVILKYVFADGTNPDTVYAWAFTENEPINEAAFVANAISAQAVVDQNTLNIVSFGQSQHGREAIDEIRIGNSFAAVIGVQGPPPDTTPPTLVNITDDRGGETMQQGQPITYTLTFSEAMDVSTISASDFGNAGTSTININSVGQPVPGTVAVTVTPVTPGTLQLRVLQGASLTDVAGNALVTTTAITDDTVITVNPAMIDVPFVVGMTESDAGNEITGASLIVGSVTTQHHASVAAGVVISQNPVGGTNVATGSGVDLVISLGPAMTTVPSVVGLPQATAESNIVAANLVVGTVTTENHNSVPAGSVISQNPSGGASVTQGSSVALVVSLGPLMATVPNVTGLVQSIAQANIIAANLVVGSVTTQNHATIPAGEVISQNPTGGASVAPESSVDLVVSLGVGSVSNYAIADIPVSGTVTDNYGNTEGSDNIYQAITEIESAGNPAKNRFSYLEHKWAFNVTGGETVTFHVEAHHTTNNESDDFVFAYSTNGVNGTWNNMFLVTKTSDNHTAQTFVLPPGTSGTLHVRVLDTNRGRGRRALDTLYIDKIHILCETGVAGAESVSDEVAWAMAFEGADLSDLSADFDRDGLSNGEERIWGLDPTSPTSCNAIQTPLDPVTGAFRYSRRDRALTGLTYSVWTSTDLVTWTEDLSAGQLPAEPDENGVLSEDVTLSPELLVDPALFIQMRADE